eukprot:g6655.t1
MTMLRAAPLICLRLVPSRACRARVTGLRAFASASSPPPTDDGERTSSASIVVDRVYVGPLCKPIRYLKRVSVLTCTSSLIAAPLLLYVGSDNVPLAGQIAFSGLVLLAGLGSTWLLHFFTSGYVHALYRALPAGAEGVKTKGADSAGMISARLLTFFAQPTTVRFRLAGGTVPLVDHWNPLVSFDARLLDEAGAETGATKRLYVEGQCFEDKRLLRQLMGRDLEPDEREFDEFDLPSWAQDDSLDAQLEDDLQREHSVAAQLILAHDDAGNTNDD